MPVTPRRRSARRSAPAGCLLFLAVVALIIVVVILLWYLLAGRLRLPGPTPPGPKEPTSQPASCPDVLMLSVPGTWESSSNDDPYNPSANPISLMLNISNPIRERFPNDRVEVYTVPYVAQFSNPIAIPPDGQQSYNKSRSEGIARATDKLAQTHRDCPLTTYVIAGFSQGAVIAGDVAADIGAGKGPVPADKVLGVTVLADGRRVDGPGQAIEVGNAPPGVGAEVALKGLNVPGITMTGPRPGFGKLADRTYTICAPGDLICDSPDQALNPVNFLSSVGTLVRAAGNPVHSLYNGYVVDDSGTTATQWTVNWAAGLIEGAPHPPHS
ncbi:cutinase family protein [Nocardia otitidiscaviarum]|uniref:cutinase family protein n=1 Tax=Nocardia otitidiscaviarum TaxID=1823 RepID=UPI0004A6FC6A|nr:cutinase family protein [Nocardia otitidiscaviarum]MBF6238058.1 cutinase family protein [Nocardia otitidiscaviarum]MBF6483770.1 cutinase family protein [Nocardia otitidiscaviarum]